MPLETIPILKAHVAIQVRNLGASIGFYRQLFGIAPDEMGAR